MAAGERGDTRTIMSSLNPDRARRQRGPIAVGAAVLEEPVIALASNEELEEAPAAAPLAGRLKYPATSSSARKTSNCDGEPHRAQPERRTAAGRAGRPVAGAGGERYRG